jgi:hypothetical protein
MTPDQLFNWVDRKMRLSADYQPRIIMTLLSAYPRKLNIASLSKKLGIPLQTFRNMPLKVLLSHMVVDYDGTNMWLNLSDELSLSDKKNIRTVLKSKLQRWERKQ